MTMERDTSNDEWACLPDSWYMFENQQGWRLTLDLDRLPSRWGPEKRQQYAKAILAVLNAVTPEREPRETPLPKPEPAPEPKPVPLPEPKPLPLPAPKPDDPLDPTPRPPRPTKLPS